MICRFVSQKRSTSILFYWRDLYSLAMEIFVKSLCNFSSGSRVKNIEKVYHTAYVYFTCECCIGYSYYKKTTIAQILVVLI